MLNVKKSCFFPSKKLIQVFVLMHFFEAPIYASQ